MSIDSNRLITHIDVNSDCLPWKAVYRDRIRLKYGVKMVIRSCFLNSGLSSMCGVIGYGEVTYPLMSSLIYLEVTE